MPSIHLRRPALGLLAVAALTQAGVAAAAGDYEPLVVRGEATAVDGPCSAAACRLDLTNGRFRGTPVGTGAYRGALKLRVADVFPNGEGGICAPLDGRIVLGAGSADRLVLAVSGTSCQDGAGPLPGSSFTGLAEFTVKRGTGRYRYATGSGQASFTEDAAKQHRITLIGRLGGTS